MKPIRKKPADLFAPAREANLRRVLPLAARMRPRSRQDTPESLTAAPVWCSGWFGG